MLQAREGFAELREHVRRRGQVQHGAERTQTAVAEAIEVRPHILRREELIGREMAKRGKLAAGVEMLVDGA